MAPQTLSYGDEHLNLARHRYAALLPRIIAYRHGENGVQQG